MLRVQRHHSALDVADLVDAEGSLTPHAALAQMSGARYTAPARGALAKVCQRVLVAACNQCLAPLDGSEEHGLKVGEFLGETMLPQRRP